nr:MAG TPA: hypothetical protein [Caudoviricetes sp.]
MFDFIWPQNPRFYDGFRAPCNFRYYEEIRENTLKEKYYGENAGNTGA